MIGRVLDDRYELVEFVGEGGMAVVYRAVDKRTGHSVAVKILKPEYIHDAEFLARFEREAATASRMSHHNIVNLLDVGQEGEMRYLVMDYVNGQTLKDVIRQKGALPPNVSAQIAIRILSALQHAHNNGIIHRDIKPQNVLVNADGLIKVSDFGIARVVGGDTLSTEDSVMGSVHYFSPEQAENKPVTFSSDLYSVGVCLYEMMTGQPPFDGETPVQVAMQHIHNKPRPMREINPAVPPAMERVVEKAMEKQPAKRYQNARDMALDLQRALLEPEGDWVQQLPDKPKTPPVKPNTTNRQKPVHTRRWLWTRIGVLSLCTLVVAALVWGGFAVYDRIVNTVEAPYCVDASEDEALRLLKAKGLQVEINRISDPLRSAGTVSLQSPEYGTVMRRNDTVLLTISTGPVEKAVPKVAGMNVNDARKELERLGFQLLPLSERHLSEKAPWDTVVAQSPEEGEMLATGGVVQVILSGGCVTLPNLVGMTEEEATLQLKLLGLVLREVQYISIQDGTQFGLVAAQRYFDSDDNQYQPGDQVMMQTQVTLAVYISPLKLPQATEEAEEPETEETPQPEETPQ